MAIDPFADYRKDPITSEPASTLTTTGTAKDFLGAPSQSSDLNSKVGGFLKGVEKVGQGLKKPVQQKAVDPFADAGGIVDPFASPEKAKDPKPPADDDYSYLEAAGRNLKGGYAELASGLGSVTGYLGERTDSDTLRDTGESMKSYWNEVAKGAPPSESAQVSPFDDPKVLADPKWWVENTARMAPSFVGPMGAGLGARAVAKAGLPGLPKIANLFGAGVGGLFGGALEGAQTYEEGLELGKDESTAATAGEAMALGSGVLNALPFYKIMNPAARGVIYNFITRGMTEGITEAMEEPLDEIIQGLVYDKEPDWEDVARRAAHVAGPAALMGGIGGAGAGMGKRPQQTETAPGEGEAAQAQPEEIVMEGGVAQEEPVSTAGIEVEELGEMEDAGSLDREAAKLAEASEMAEAVNQEIVMEGPAQPPLQPEQGTEGMEVTDRGNIAEEITMEGHAQPDMSDFLERGGIARNDGTPFPTKKAAQLKAKSRKLASYEPVKIGSGWGLRPAAAQTPAETPISPPQTPQEAGKPVQPESPQDLDQAAQQAATSPQNKTPEPSPEAIEAGNYRKGHVKINGMDVSIENPKGSTRSGTNRQGKQWSRTLKDHYGYLRGTRGRDKEHVDVFMTDQAHRPDRPVFVVDQVDPETGAFDEGKVIMGTRNEDQARRVYQRNYEDGWQGLGAITQMSQDEFKAWTRGDTTKPVALKEKPTRQPKSEAKPKAEEKEKPAPQKPEKAQQSDLVGQYVRSGSTTGKVKSVSEDGKKATLESGGTVPVGRAPNWAVQSEPFEGAKKRAEKEKPATEPTKPKKKAKKKAAKKAEPEKLRETVVGHIDQAETNIMESVSELRSTVGAKASDKAGFDRILLDLASEGVVDLHRHAFPYGVPEEQRAQFVKDEQGYFYNALSKRKDRPAKKPETRETDQGTAMFSVEGETAAQPRGMSVADATNSLRQIIGKKAFDRLVASGRFEIVQQQNEIPEVAQRSESGEAGPGRVKGMYSPTERKSYIVAGNIRPEQLQGVFLHEVGAHYGLPRMIGRGEYEKVKRQLQNLHRIGNKRIVEARNRVPKNTPDEYVWDETLAYLAEKNHDMPLVQRIIAKVRSFLKQLGILKANQLQPNDMIELVRGAARHAVRTTPRRPVRTRPGVYDKVAKGLAPSGTAQSYAEQVRQMVRNGQITQSQADRIIPWLNQHKRTPSPSERLDETVLDIPAKRSKVIRRDDVLAFLRSEGYRPQSERRYNRPMASERGDRSDTPQPRERSEAVTLYHGTYDSGAPQVTVGPVGIDGDNVFDGLFMSPSKEAAASHGENVFPYEVQSIATSADLEGRYDEVVEALSGEVDGTREQLEELADLVIEDGHNEAGDLAGILEPRSATGDIGWELQRLRGRAAAALGYDAVEMQDEHGTTYLVVRESFNQSAPDTGALFSKSKRRTSREKLRDMGMDFENLPGDEVGSQPRATEPVDQEPDVLSPEEALEELEKQGFDKPMLSVDDEGGEGTLNDPAQQERAQRSITGNRVTEPETDADGLALEDPRLDPLSKDLGKLVGFFESATDKLRRSNHPMLRNLAKKVDAYYDGHEARMGWINGRVRPALKKIPMRKRKQAMRDFGEYWRHHDNDRTADAEAVIKRNPVVGDLVERVKDLYSEMGDVNQATGVQVYDAGLYDGKGGWRLIGKVPRGKFWPRAFSPEVQRVLSNPKNDLTLWNELADALINEGHIESRTEMDRYTRGYMGREIANDYFSGIEKARQRKLPEQFYDYSWDGFNRYARKWSSRVTQIEQFGQVTTQGTEDAFTSVINSTKDAHTQNYIAALAEHVYSRRPTDVYTTMLQHLNLIATATQLGNPATATLNFIGGTSLNVQMYGWRRVGKAYLQMMRQWRVLQQTGVDYGILGKDVLNILRDTEHSAASYIDASGRVKDSLARFAAFTMKWGGYKGTENIIRMNAMVASQIQLQDALHKWNKNPNSGISKKYRVFMQRNRIDPDKLLAENGKGEETSRYLRMMVNIPQGSYRPDMVPLYVDSPVGRFLFKYQKFGTQVSRMFWQNHLRPFVASVQGGETVEMADQSQRRVRTFLPLLRYFTTAFVGGSAVLAARAFLFNYNDPGPDWDDLEEALKDDERALTWALIFDRAYYSMMAASAAGFFGNYIQFGLDFADQQRVKNPLDPPGLASLDAVRELVMRTMEQGKLTGRDLDQIGERTLALYRGYKRPGLKAAAMSGAEWKEARLQQAYSDLTYVRKMTRRYADEMEMKNRRTFSGRFGRTPMSPVYQEIYENLILGDAESARAVARQTMLEAEDPKKARRAMASSARARHPWNVGASQSRKNDRGFLEWAKENTSPANYQRIFETGMRYERTRKRTGL